jgi:hypothetical protein
MRAIQSRTYGKYPIKELGPEIDRLLRAYCNHGGWRIPIEDLAAECGKPQIRFPMKWKATLVNKYITCGETVVGRKGHWTY